MEDKPLTAEDIAYWIRWNRFFDDNLIYCEDTHSFVHRLFDRCKKWKTYHDAQNDAFQVIKEMQEEFDIEYKKISEHKGGKDERN